MRRFTSGEEAVADHGVAGRQPASGRRPCPEDDLTQAGADTPMRRQPGERRRIGRPQREDWVRHRQQRMQIERAGKAVPDPGTSLGLADFDPFAELPCQDAAAGDRQVAGLQRLGDGTGKNIFLDAGEIEPPGDDAGATRGGSEIRDRFGRAADRQAMVQPVRRSCGLRRRRLAHRRPSAARLCRLRHHRRRRRRGAFRRAVRRRFILPGIARGKFHQRSSRQAGLSLTRPARWT